MDGRRSLRIGGIATCIIATTLAHYLIPLHHPALHDILQRFYYLPIILAALWFGLRGGLLAGILVSVVYLPHVVFQWGGHLTIELEKYLEIVLYNLVGGVTGLLAEREARQRLELQATAQGLEESYRALQQQTEQLLRAEEQLRQAERLSMLGELSATLAHEIRNPLGAIKGTAEILADGNADTARRQEFLQILMRESERLNRVVEDFLQLARPTRPAAGEVAVRREVEELLLLMDAEAARRGVTVSRELAVVPAIRGDGEKLRQVFLNLLLNALQAAGKGGRVTVTLAEEVHGDGRPGLVLTVSDSGPGIPAEILSRVFEPFFTTKQGGTGLGLVIAQRIVTAHGGQLTVASAAGQGTSFRVWLPVGAGW